MSSYGEKIAGLRKEKGMTQAELGEKLNVTFQAVSKWERGESLPDFETMSRLSKLFEVPLSYFQKDGEEVAATEVAPEPIMLGVCTRCGRVVREGDESQTDPDLVCKKCAERKIAADKKRKEEDEKKKAEAARAVEHARIAKDSANKKKVITGLIIGAVVAVILAVIDLVSLANTGKSASSGTRF